jgi:tRNA/tmRNA/rRNA uracil-C5-methylase (TrmA/RlmC/RlmD family)
VKVLQACCGTDEIPRQVACWQASGYRVVNAVPLDLFAGTAHLETLLLLEPVQ